MLVPILVAAAAVVSPVSGTYVGRTSEHKPVRIVVRGGHVVRAAATVDTYRCEPEGEMGGLRMDVPVDAAFRGGTFRFDGGDTPRFLKASGRVKDRRTLTGRLRVHGTIGTGDPCTSPTVRFTVTRR